MNSPRSGVRGPGSGVLRARRNTQTKGLRTPDSGLRTLPEIAITIGDPAGVGPEIALKAAVDPAVLKLCQPVLIGSRALLMRVARKLKLRVPKNVVDPTPDFSAADVVPGTVQAANGAAAARWVDAAIAGCREGRFAAMVTCPLNKEALAAGGVPFPGHTELLAHRCGVSGEIMLMYDKKIAVALVTVHQAYTSVPGSLSVERIVHAGELLAAALRRLRKGEPRIAVLGLNPHAGEHGLFGDEEARFVVPAVEELRRRGVHCDGPLPPDTAFAPLNRKRYAGHVCLYHDQGLIPFKALAFDDGVNVTLGLPIVRTSVDHGTAFDIAWKGKATQRSLVSAIGLAVKLSQGEQAKTILSSKFAIVGEKRLLAIQREIKARRPPGESLSDEERYPVWERYDRSIRDVLRLHGKVGWGNDVDFYHGGDWFSEWYDGFSLQTPSAFVVLTDVVVTALQKTVSAHHAEAMLEFGSDLDSGFPGLSVLITSRECCVAWSKSNQDQCRTHLKRLGFQVS